MKFEDFLNESTFNDLLKEDKIFIMIIGGAGSGKNFIYKKHLSKLPLLDIDEFSAKHAKGDFELARKFVGKAAGDVKKELLRHFAEGKSVVNTATGASLSNTMNKFKWAKEAGMKTAVVLVDVDVKVALQRNKDRAAKGDQGLLPDWKVESSNKDARENFKEYAKITDYSIKVKS